MLDSLNETVRRVHTLCYLRYTRMEYLSDVHESPICFIRSCIYSSVLFFYQCSNIGEDQHLERQTTFLRAVELNWVSQESEFWATKSECLFLFLNA